MYCLEVNFYFPETLLHLLHTVDLHATRSSCNEHIPTWATTEPSKVKPLSTSIWARDSRL